MTIEEWKNANYTCFAFYGFSRTTIPIGELYEWTLEWFRKLNCEPDTLGMNLNGKSSGKYMKFKNGDRKLREGAFQGTSHWGMIDVPTEYHKVKNGEYHAEDFSVSYNIEISCQYFVSCIYTELAKDRMQDYLTFAKEACEKLKPQYGIGYHRIKRHIPGVFGAGFDSGPPENTFDNLGFWRDLNSANCFKYLRDVFRWNYFTETQLKLKIDGTDLESWIKTDPSRGSLEYITDQVALWTVPLEMIPSMRHALWEAKLILDRRRDCDPIWQKYQCGHEEIVNTLITGIPPKMRDPGPGLTEEQVLDMFTDENSEVLKVVKPGVVEKVKNPKRRKK